MEAKETLIHGKQYKCWKNKKYLGIFIWTSKTHMHEALFIRMSINDTDEFVHEVLKSKDVIFEIFEQEKPVKMITIKTTDNKKAKSIIEEFKKAATPLLKYLNNKHHPHVTAIITSTSIELVEGICSVPKIYEYLQD